MSRHRDVRKLDHDAEYDDVYDGDVYGHSVDDNEYGISPGSEEYLYQRGQGNYGFASYFPTSEDIQEEDTPNHMQGRNRPRHDSVTYERPKLSSENQVRLDSALDELRNIVGDKYSEGELIRQVIAHNYDFERALDALLNQHSSTTHTSPEHPLPQRPQLRTPGPTAAATSGVQRMRVNENRSSAVVTPKVVRGFNIHNNQGVNHAVEDEVVVPPIVPNRQDRESPAVNRPPTRVRDKEVDVARLYESQRGSGKDLLNLVVVGHVDAGKSTLMGHLLYLQGNVTQRTMHKYEQESKKIGKQSFMYAWVLDDTEEERSRGITVDIAQRQFETTTKSFTLLDAPGHRDFIPNMITGAARADVAILVVDATTGAFEAGFDSGGQTREHAFLVRALGVSQLAVAVNKIDTVDYSEARFNEVTSSLKVFLKTAGFKESDVKYIPCSGLTGENLVKSDSTELKSWYSGPTLLQTIDCLKVPQREYLKPLRMCVSDVYKGQGSSMCLGGKLDTGYVQNNDRLVLMPGGDGINIKGVQADNGEPGFAYAGDHLTLTVQGADPNTMHIGDFICDPISPIPQVTKIQARVVIFNITVPIIKGSQVDFHYQSVTEPCKIRKLVSQLHKTTGQEIKKRPRALVKNTSAIVQLEFVRPLCLELYRDYKELGRFMLRNSGTTIAAGLVTQLFE